MLPEEELLTLLRWQIDFAGEQKASAIDRPFGHLRPAASLTWLPAGPPAPFAPQRCTAQARIFRETKIQSNELNVILVNEQNNNKERYFIYLTVTPIF